MVAMKWIDSAEVRNGYMYCLPGKGRILYKIALHDFSVSKTVEVSGQSQDYWKLYVRNDDFFCISKSGSEIVRWNETTEEVTVLAFAEKMPERSEIVGYKDKIWMIPRMISEDLYFYSITEKKYDKCESWQKHIKKLGIAGRVENWHYNDNRVFLIVGNEKKILEFNMDTEQLTSFIMPVDGHVKDLVVQGDKFYFLVDNDTAIHCWNPQREKVFHIESTVQKPCSRLIVAGDAIIIDTGNSVALLRNDKISKTDIIIKKGQARSAFLKAINYNSSWLVMPWGVRFFIIFSESFDSYSINKAFVPLKDAIDTETLLYEGDISLKEWLQYLTEKKA